VTQVVPSVSAYTVIAGLSGVVTGLLAVSIYRETTGQSDERRYDDLVRPFLLVLVLFTAAAFSFAVAAVNGPPESAFAGLTLFLISLPWVVFALRQAGRGYLLSRWRVGALLATEFPILVVLSLGSAPGIEVSTLPESFALAASSRWFRWVWCSSRPASSSWRRTATGAPLSSVVCWSSSWSSYCCSLHS